MSLSVALQAALQSLLAHQTALAVTAQNTANAQNPNYSRQVVRLRPSVSVPDPNFGRAMLGSGVFVAGVDRQHDALIASALRLNDGRVGYHGTVLGGLERIEAVFSEPSGNGLSSLLSAFFESWRDLSVSPENIGNRTVVLERARNLIGRFHTIQDQLTNEGNFLRLHIQGNAKKLNELLEQIAELNEQIASGKASGASPNDLMDERDALLRKVSELLTVQVYEQSNGSITVIAQGQELVSGNLFRSVKVVTGNDGSPKLVFNDTGDDVPLGDGIFAALRDLGQKIIKSLKDALTNLLNSFAQAVNQLHQQGFGLDGSTNRPFFVLNNGEWEVNPDLISDPNRIAASQTGAPGDGGIALAIADLRDTQLSGLGNKTVLGFYLDTISEFAGLVETTKSNQKVFSEIRNSLLNQRDSISGVSLDEEMVNLMKFQQAYIAAARIIQTVDSMVSDLLSRL